MTQPMDIGQLLSFLNSNKQPQMQMPSANEMIISSPGESAFVGQMMSQAGKASEAAAAKNQAANLHSSLAPFIATALQSNKLTPEQKNRLGMMHEMIGQPGASAKGISGLLDMLSQRGGVLADAAKQANKIENPLRGASYKFARDAGYEPGTPEFDEAVRQHGMKSGITLNTGVEARMGTPEENMRWGYAADLPTYWNAKSGKLEPVQKVSGEQGRYRAYLDAMDISEKELDAVTTENPDFDPGNMIDFAARTIKEFGSIGEALGGHFESEDSKKYFTSALNWISANRAYISGAAVPEIEVKRDFMTYFPKPDDSPAVVALKKRLRENRKDALAKTATMSEEERQQRLRQTADLDNLKVRELEADEAANVSSQPKSGDPVPGHEGWTFE